MDPVLVLTVLGGLVAASTALGLVWKFAQGRIRRTDGLTVVAIADLPGVTKLARGATLLQFSTEVCAPCAAMRRVLGTIASDRADVTHIELDLSARPDLATRFGILQTPTTLVLDASGGIRSRIGGAARPDVVLEQLAQLT